jgi:hypothetical protein
MARNAKKCLLLCLSIIIKACRGNVGENPASLAAGHKTAFEDEIILNLPCDIG